MALQVTSQRIQDDHDTLITAQVDSEEDDSVHFSPLNANLSYFATLSALEVVPTKDITKFKRRGMKYRKNYGSPKGNDINTRHVSGKKIDIKHTQFALSAGMMLGVRECVGGVNSLPEEDELDDSKTRTLEEECARVEKVKIPAGAYIITSHIASLPYRYKFKAYAPHIFARIRTFAGVEKQRFLHSICGNDAFIEFISNAKSGQFFFYSHDGRYMIKTQTQEEKNFLRQILPDYYVHLRDNPHSFITHFYGMYRVKIPELGKSIHFVIMKSVFNTEKEIHKIWDLKGSTLGRYSKRGESVHKDLDFVSEGRKLYVGQKAKGGIMNQLKKDSDFLAKMRIMDYSLLLGVHVCTRGEQKKERKAHLMRSNTPMRRQQKHLFGDGEKDNVLRRIMESARERLVSKQSKTEEDRASDNDETDSEKGDQYLDSQPELTTVLSDEVSVIKPSTPNPFTSRDDFGILSQSGDSKEIYFGGIIDILQLYNTRKWGETIARKAAGNPEKAISCVHPDVYARRFVEFIESLIE